MLCERKRHMIRGCNHESFRPVPIALVEGGEGDVPVYNFEPNKLPYEDSFDFMGRGVLFGSSSIPDYISFFSFNFLNSFLNFLLYLLYLGILGLNWKEIGNLTEKIWKIGKNFLPLPSVKLIHKSMSKKVFSYQVDCFDKLDLASKILTLVSTVKGMSGVSPILGDSYRNAMTFYLVYGYSKSTKDLILASLGINSKGLNQINTVLTKRGYLINSPYSQRTKLLSPEMETLRSYFFTENSPSIMLLKFNSKISTSDE